MVVVALLLAAGAALAFGYTSERPELVAVALGLSIVAAFLVLLPRLGFAGLLARSKAEVPEPVAPEVPPADVVAFVPGRTTFHRPGCSVLGDRPSSSATREQLASGGMTPCKRCLP